MSFTPKVTAGQYNSMPISSFTLQGGFLLLIDLISRQRA